MMPIHTVRRLARPLPGMLPLLAAAIACWWVMASAVRLLAPAAPALLTLDAPQPQAAAGSVAQQAWFGSSQQGQAAVAAPPLQVLGVLGGGHGSQQDFAIVLENGQPQALRVGRQSPGGWWLRRVDGSGVVIQQEGGQEVRVALSPPAANVAASGALPPAQAGQIVPPQGMPMATESAAVAPPPQPVTGAGHDAPANKD